MITCREVNRRLTAFLGRELSLPQRMEVYRHLARCEACAAEVERARDALDLTRAACAKAKEPAPDEVPDTLVSAILLTSRR